MITITTNVMKTVTARMMPTIAPTPREFEAEDANVLFPLMEITGGVVEGFLAEVVRVVTVVEDRITGMMVGGVTKKTEATPCCESCWFKVVKPVVSSVCPAFEAV